MEYTISKKANKKIAKDMEIIISEIRKKYPEIISIILSGLKVPSVSTKITQIFVSLVFNHPNSLGRCDITHNDT